MKKVNLSDLLITGSLGLALAMSVGCGGGDVREDPDEAAKAGFYDIPESEVPEIEIVMPEPAPVDAAVTKAATEGATTTFASSEEDETEEEIMQDFQDQLDEANDALESFVDDMGRFPKSMKEVLDVGELTSMPKPPPGKKLHFDRSSRRLVWVDK